MNERIDLAKILKDCPKGTKLYSPIFGELDFEEIRSDEEYAIFLRTGVVSFPEARREAIMRFFQSGFYLISKDKTINETIF